MRDEFAVLLPGTTIEARRKSPIRFASGSTRPARTGSGPRRGKKIQHRRGELIPERAAGIATLLRVADEALFRARMEAATNELAEAAFKASAGRGAPGAGCQAE